MPRSRIDPFSRDVQGELTVLTLAYLPYFNLTGVAIGRVDGRLTVVFFIYSGKRISRKKRTLRKVALPSSVTFRTPHGPVKLPAQPMDAKASPASYSLDWEPGDVYLGGDPVQTRFGMPGTMAACVKDRSRRRQRYVLSAAHVLVPSRRVARSRASGRRAADVFQPKSDKNFAILSKGAPPSFLPATDWTDAALARVTRGRAVGLTTGVREIGRLRQPLMQPKLGCGVQLYGNTAHYADGRLLYVGTFVDSKILYRDMLAFSAICGPGDSGSLLVDRQNRPLGIVVVGGGTYNLACRISRVIEDLGLQGWRWS